MSCIILTQATFISPSKHYEIFPLFQSCTDCLYTEASSILFEAWIHILSDRKNPFPPEFCKQTSVLIFDMYLQCHLFTPEGKRSIEEKDLDREEITVEEDDKIKYKEQLQTIGRFRSIRAPSQSDTTLKLL